MDVRGGFSPSCCSTTPFQFNLACDLVFLQLYVAWIVYYVSMIWHLSFSLYVNKPSAWLETSRTQGLCFLVGTN